MNDSTSGDRMEDFNFGYRANISTSGGRVIVFAGGDRVKECPGADRVNVCAGVQSRQRGSDPDPEGLQQAQDASHRSEVHLQLRLPLPLAGRL